MTIEKQNSVALTTASYIIIITGVMYAQSIIAPLLMALFISIVCIQPITWLQKKKVPQALAILIVFGGIISIFFGFGKLIGASLSSFSEAAPLYEKNLGLMWNSVLQFFESRGINFSSDEMSNLFDPTKVMSVTAQFLGQLGGFMGNAFTIFFLVLFLLVELNGLPVKVKAIIEDSANSPDYLQAIANSIRHYLSIKTFTSLLTGFFIWICLEIIGVDYAIIWGLIAFLLNYIPNIGSILAAIPAVLFSLIQLGASGAVWTTLSFLLINLLIGNAVEPKIMGTGLGLSTFVVFFALLFWGYVLGAVGMFLSVPITMAIKIILEQNPKTKGIAIFLGTEKEAQIILDKRNKSQTP